MVISHNAVNKIINKREKRMEKKASFGILRHNEISTEEILKLYESMRKQSIEG